MKFVMVVAAAAASTSLLAPTVACAQTDQVSTSVSYRDLNLEGAAGQARLNKRVKQAARQMCADDAVRGLSRQSQVRDCVSGATSNADEQVRQALASRQTRLAAR